MYRAHGDLWRVIHAEAGEGGSGNYHCLDPSLAVAGTGRGALTHVLTWPRLLQVLRLRSPGGGRLTGPKRACLPPG